MSQTTDCQKCPHCEAGWPIENGRHRIGMPGGYITWYYCRANGQEPERAIADYLIRSKDSESHG